MSQYSRTDSLLFRTTVRALGGTSKASELSELTVSELLFLSSLVEKLCSSSLSLLTTRFLDYTLNWVKPTLAAKNISVAYMAERSLEDEIGQKSAIDITTISVTYVVMFVYVTLALGEFFSWERVLVSSQLRRIGHPKGFIRGYWKKCEPNCSFVDFFCFV